MRASNYCYLRRFTCVLLDLLEVADVVQPDRVVRAANSYRQTARVKFDAPKRPGKCVEIERYSDNKSNLAATIAEKGKIK